MTWKLLDAGALGRADAGEETGLVVDRLLICAAVFVVAVSLIGLAAALAGVFKAPQVLVLSFIVTGFYVYASGPSVLPGKKPYLRHVLLLLFVALLFRLPAYHYVMGGQDEGVYVNIAHYIEQTGGISVRDDINEQLKNTPFQDLYQSDNSVDTRFLAGVYKRKGQDTELEFQFYHVFPVWMALAGDVFGAQAGVYALTILSLLSIVYFYRLALLLTASHRAALAAGGLLALSPLHAFFSKFPVTEVPALCFALIGFLLLAAYSSASGEQRRRRWLVTSALAFLCVFTTRISGFMYVPFFVAMAWVVLLLDQDRTRRVMLQMWAMGITVVYLASVVYGLIFSGAYAHDIYRLSFQPLLGLHWRGVLRVLGILLLVGWSGLALLARRWRKTGAVSIWLTPLLQWGPPIVVFAALILGLFNMYRLGWTDHYSSDSWLATRWNLSHGGWQSAAATSLWTTIVFMGPLLVLAFLLLIVRQWSDARITFLRWFVAGFFAYAALLQWVIPYSPYYARYLLSELVPYTILFVVCAWNALAAGFWRATLSVAVCLSLFYAAALSAAQIGKNENDGCYAALSGIVTHVGPFDLILLDVSPGSQINQSQIKTPLMYTFHRAVVTVGAAALQNPNYLFKLDSLYDDVFLLTTKRISAPSFVRVDNAHFKLKSYKPNHSFPHKLISSSFPLNLYRLEQVRIPVGSRVFFFDEGSGSSWLDSGWSYQEPWGTWSDSGRAILSIDPQDLPDSKSPLALLVDAHVLVTPGHPVQRIDVAINGKRIASYVGKYPATSLTMRIPLGTPRTNPQGKIKIEFSLPDAIAPRALGSSGDARHLALGIVDAQILPATASSTQESRE